MITDNWHKIAETITEINFGVNDLAILNVAGKTITIARHKDQLFACTQKCPHAGGLLSDGYIDAVGNIVCPLHRYKYNLKTGRNASGEGYYLKTYSVETREDGVFVNIGAIN